MPSSSHDTPRPTVVTAIYRPPNVAAPGHDLDAALAAIDAVTAARGADACLVRYVAAAMLRSGAYANAGRMDDVMREFQSALSAFIASQGFEKLFGLSRDDVAALIGAN